MIVVKLHVYRGKEILKREDGSVKNENQTVKLAYGALEWVNYLKNIHVYGYCKVEVESIRGFGNHESKDLTEEGKKIKEELNKAFFGDKEVKLTADQIKIAELEAKMEELLGSDSKKGGKGSTGNTNVDAELEAARAKYKEVLGEDAHHAAKVDSINKAIAKAQLEKQ